MYAAINSPKPGYEFAEAEWFCEVIVRTGCQGLHHVVHLIANTHDDDSSLRGEITDLPASLNAIETRHLQIEQDEVKMPLPDGSQSFFPTSSFFCSKSAGP